MLNLGYFLRFFVNRAPKFLEENKRTYGSNRLRFFTWCMTLLFKAQKETTIILNKILHQTMVQQNNAIKL